MEEAEVGLRYGQPKLSIKARKVRNMELPTEEALQHPPHFHLFISNLPHPKIPLGFPELVQARGL